MLSPLLKQSIQQRLEASNLEFFIVSGGSINKTFRIETGDRKQHFFKCNSATKFPHLFANEVAGLKLIAAQNVIQLPAVIDVFEVENHQILLLEWIEEGNRTPAFWKTFGEQLSALHFCTSDCFGLPTNNYMGAVPQVNTQAADWASFFQNHRLAPLAEKCYKQGRLQPMHLEGFEKLYTRLDDIFEPSTPSLLHGDLWSANFMCSRASEPVLIDPAVYYGHRSMDLAMTTLFGGFDTSFYKAYEYHFPFPPNYQEQWEVCNLYPLLVHLHLFGTSYLPQIQTTLSRFV